MLLIIRSLFLLILLSVSHLAFSACTAIPSYDPATGKITIPCLNVLSKTYSIDLQQRTTPEAHVFDLNLYTVKLVSDATVSYATVSDATTQYKIGDKGPAGGIVYYVDSTGQHGLEAQPKDATVGGQTSTQLGLSTSGDEDKYSNGSLQYFYTWSEAITAGNSYGAGWHLPTKDELNLLYQQRSVVGGIDGSNYVLSYWSSTGYSASEAWYQHFYDGLQYRNNKGLHYLVRAVRAF